MVSTTRPYTSRTGVIWQVLPSWLQLGTVLLAAQRSFSFTMFNAPRPAQRYTGSTSNGFSGSFVDDNPLASSMYSDAGLDPWSAAPSPIPTPAPQAPASVFSAVIGTLWILKHDNARQGLTNTLQRMRRYQLYTIAHMQPLIPAIPERLPSLRYPAFSILRPSPRAPLSGSVLFL
jgi:hypothetical protein